MKTNDIKKGTEIKTDQLGMLVSGTMEDNLKGNTRMIKTNGSEIGMFDEFGSVYVWNIRLAKNSEGNWEEVELTDKQQQVKEQNDALGF